MTRVLHIKLHKNLDTLINLEELYLDSNQIPVIKGLGYLKKLSVITLEKNSLHKQYVNSVYTSES
ncbi:hypothetical protein LCGC14_0802710 [marine sediment metagenome]|uniref:Leucine-rich repeat domain-containing protein n=1 Tax=marine sediment metagenome TaxID=412755 RepID=A0A0F9PTR8_9ZZZZ|nr:MAG: leucine-rich repeat domain protein [Candidatus Lokiarchaeum sp. GC14_75]